MDKEYNFIDAMLLTEALDGLFSTDEKEASHICDVVEKLLGGYNLQTSVSLDIDRETLMLAYIGKIVSELAKEATFWQNKSIDEERQRLKVERRLFGGLR